MCLCVRSSALPTNPPTPLLSHGCLAPHSERELTKHDGHMIQTPPFSPVKPGSKCSIGSCRKTSLVPGIKQCHLFPISGSWVCWIQVLCRFTCLSPSALCHHGAIIKGHSLRSCCQSLQTSLCSDLPTPILITSCTCKSALLRRSQWCWLSNAQKGSTREIFQMHSETFSVCLFHHANFTINLTLKGTNNPALQATCK